MARSNILATPAGVLPFPVFILTLHTLNKLPSELSAYKIGVTMGWMTWRRVVIKFPGVLWPLVFLVLPPQPIRRW